MSGQVTLYDLPSKGRCTSWSLNPWKTRAALNFKGIPYTTEWIEYPDVAPKFEGLVPPNDEGMAYTIPIVKMPDGTTIMDSLKIAPELEKLKPEPSLHFDSPLVTRTQQAVLKARAPLDPILMPRVPRQLLNPRSAEYFEETRAKRYGMPLAELEKSDRAKGAWAAAEEGFKDLKTLVHENEAGPYLMGETPSYADFIAMGFFHFVKLLGDDVFDKTMAHDLGFPRLYLACEPWVAKDD